MGEKQMKFYSSLPYIWQQVQGTWLISKFVKYGKINANCVDGEAVICSSVQTVQLIA